MVAGRRHVVCSGVVSSLYRRGGAVCLSGVDEDEMQFTVSYGVMFCSRQTEANITKGCSARTNSQYVAFSTHRTMLSIFSATDNTREIVISMCHSR